MISFSAFLLKLHETYLETAFKIVFHYDVDHHRLRSPNFTHNNCLGFDLICSREVLNVFVTAVVSTKKKHILQKLGSFLHVFKAFSSILSNVVPLEVLTAKKLSSKKIGNILEVFHKKIYYHSIFFVFLQKSFQHSSANFFRAFSHYHNTRITKYQLLRSFLAFQNLVLQSYALLTLVTFST